MWRDFHSYKSFNRVKMFVFLKVVSVAAGEEVDLAAEEDSAVGVAEEEEEEDSGEGVEEEEDEDSEVRCVCVCVH